MTNYGWLKEFLKQNAEYLVQKQKYQTVDGTKSHNVYDMRDYFEKIKPVIEEKQITNLNVWKIDKISFQIAFEKCQLVLTMNLIKLLQIIDLKNSNYIIFVIFIGSAN